MYILSSDIFTESAEKCCQQIFMKPQYYRRLFKKLLTYKCWQFGKKMYLCTLKSSHCMVLLCSKSDLPFDMKNIVLKAIHVLIKVNFMWIPQIKKKHFQAFKIYLLFPNVAGSSWKWLFFLWGETDQSVDDPNSSNVFLL